VLDTGAASDHALILMRALCAPDIQVAIYARPIVA
jgi:signal transduction protein with GAF and PtsI domain